MAVITTVAEIRRAEKRDYLFSVHTNQFMSLHQITHHPRAQFRITCTFPFIGIKSDTVWHLLHANI